MPIPFRNQLIVDVPAVVALEETYDATISASTEITLNTAATFIEVTAIDKTILLKWGTDNAVTTDFDHAIPLNSTRVFQIPAGITAVNFIEQAATAILAMSEF